MHPWHMRSSTTCSQCTCCMPVACKGMVSMLTSTKDVLAVSQCEPLTHVYIAIMSPIHNVFHCRVLITCNSVPLTLTTIPATPQHGAHINAHSLTSMHVPTVCTQHMHETTGYNGQNTDTLSVASTLHNMTCILTYSGHLSNTACATLACAIIMHCYHNVHPLRLKPYIIHFHHTQYIALETLHQAPLSRMLDIDITSAAQV
ncbi:hypothetical protein V8C86DRAFT_3147863 [Haematococcus lacustris]